MKENIIKKNNILVNLSIPRTMTLDGLFYLGSMASLVPENGIIVEVGPLYGSSTWVLSKNAHPSVKIYSIDTWENAQWIEKFQKKNIEQNIKDFSLESFKFYTKDCKNVIPIQGFSPTILQDNWSQKIDMYFDDAAHGNPEFINNINFFKNFLKNEYIICGDDYSSGWPDILKEVINLEQVLKKRKNIAGRVWAISNIDNFEQKIIKNLFLDHPECIIEGIYINDEVLESREFFWNNIHNFKIIKHLKIKFVNLTKQSYIYFVGTKNNQQVEIFANKDNGYILDIADFNLYSRLSFDLLECQKYKLNYQYSSVDLIKKKLNSNSRVKSANSANSIIHTNVNNKITGFRFFFDLQDK